MKLRSSLILIGTAAAGITLNSRLADDVATWVIERTPYLHSFENIHHAVGEALLVAVALALFVDPILKRDIARDAFQAAFGYALPRACYALCMKSAARANMRHTNATICSPARVEAYTS